MTDAVRNDEGFAELLAQRWAIRTVNSKGSKYSEADIPRLIDEYRSRLIGGSEEDTV